MQNNALGFQFSTLMLLYMSQFLPLENIDSTRQQAYTPPSVVGVFQIRSQSHFLPISYLLSSSSVSEEKHSRKKWSYFPLRFFTHNLIVFFQKGRDEVRGSKYRLRIDWLWQYSYFNTAHAHITFRDNLCNIYIHKKV